MISRREFSQLAVVAAVSLSGCASTQALRTSTAGSHESFVALKQVKAGLLNVGYAEDGPAGGPPVVLLHGWPYDIHSYADVAPLLAANGYRVIVPYLRGYGTTAFLSSDTFRNGQQSAVALDVIALMDALQIPKAVLGGFDWGSRTAAIVAALWPERCKALVAVSGYLITDRTANLQPLAPQAEYGWWYQYYFATDRGVEGYRRYTRDFNKLIWKTASPKWNFDDATYDRTAASFTNPDHVAIVIHNYRWRLSLANGEPQYDPIEQQLSAMPVITVPAITIASDFDGPAADGTSYRSKFAGKYAHRFLPGIGHNVPQEAPQDFANAVVEVDGY
ncbi:alpha/beta hydrolase [Rhodococcus olei]|uniref:Alpha/beta hydrolase n=1 Tax=Rhodococcus olei TaxID=2161675 RepID=A0ABP8P6W4_9NOCA